MELQRLEASLELSARAPNRDLAEAKLREAIATAQQQAAKWWELRAAVTLSRFLRGQQRTDEARALLAPVYRRFVEGFETPFRKRRRYSTSCSEPCHGMTQLPQSRWTSA